MANKGKGNATWVKGGPSPNPAGRGAPLAKAKSSKPPGSDGIVSYSGYLQTGERGALSGANKWLTYSNAINQAVVATGVRYFGNLLAGTKWTAVENPLGGEAAKRGAEIVRQGLLDAPLTHPWSMVVRKASMYRILGFSIHAVGFGRRPDGLIAYTDIAHRPQHTIDKWIRPDDTKPWEAVEQLTSSGQRYTIPLDQAFYCVDDTLTDSPEGVGLLRHVIELVRRLGAYEALEGVAYFSDMGGTPIIRAPIEEIANGASDEDALTKILAATAAIRDIAENRIKSPERQMFAMLDSATYRGSNPDTISGIQKWALEMVQSSTNGLAEMHQVIGRIELQIARVLGIEFAMVGGGATAGSYGMHEDKTSMFASNLQTTLAEVGSFATRQLARRLIRLNGLDPDTACPTLVAEPISTDAILTVTQALAQLSMAGLRPDDPARNVIRERLRLPDEPDAAPGAMMPRLPVRPTAPVDAATVPEEVTGV